MNHADLNENPEAKKSDAKENFWRTQTLLNVFRLSAVVLGAIQAWAGRFVMNPDGVSYLDLSDAFARGDWQSAVNALWSPLYPFALSIAMRILQPSPYSEFAVAHFVNFLAYLCTIAAFEYVLRGVLIINRNIVTNTVINNPKDTTRLRMPLPEQTLIIVGYSLFIWAMLVLIKLSTIAPDLLFTAFLFAAVGVLLRIKTGATLSRFAALGVLLGFGYLAKSPMLPLMPVFIFIAVVSASVKHPDVRRYIKYNLPSAAARGLVALACFLCLAAPFALTLSHIKGRWTFGDSARLNYIWHINQVSNIHLQGEPAPHGTPLHTTRKIFDAPAVYEFATPIKSTYPPWFDPSYWYEGVTSHFNLRQQLKAASLSLVIYREYFDVFGALLLGLTLFITLYLFFYRADFKLLSREFAMYGALLVPGLIGLCMYVPVHAEHRYLAPFLVLVYIALVAAVRVPDALDAKRLVSSATAIIVVLFIIATMPGRVRETLSVARDLTLSEAATSHTQWQIAQRLQQLGLQTGAPVATIGDAGFSYWARIGRWRIVAEIPHNDPENHKGQVNMEANIFWQSNGNIREQALSALASSGARAVVADNVPSWVAAETLNEWQRVTTQPNCYVRFF